MVEPKWNRTTNSAVSQMADCYKKNITDIATAMAAHGKAETVLINHIDDAHTALANAGLSRLPFLSRVENETALGGIFIGLAIGSSDLMAVFFAEGPEKVGATKVCFAACIAIGLFLYFHGWYRSKVPSSAGIFTWLRQKVRSLWPF
jgi:hypothetical protein